MAGGCLKSSGPLGLTSRFSSSALELIITGFLAEELIFSLWY